MPEAVRALLADTVAVRRMHFRTWTDERRRKWFEWCIENGGRADADVTTPAGTATLAPPSSHADRCPPIDDH